jgi:NAD(P)-dependent dehydrogenase (short-subunit alcohol dehydrogenase family)
MSAKRPRVIVLGASGTLGRVVASSLAAAGARVGLTYRTGQAVAAELGERLDGAVVRHLDLTVTADIPRVLADLRDELGGLDALVHCATLGSATDDGTFDTVESATEAGWDRLMSVNVRSAFFAAQYAASVMREGGNLVFLGSIDGVKSVPAPIAYATSKGALRAMATSLAKELGPKNIRVNVVAPGILEAGASRLLPDDLRAQYLRHSGSKRLGRLEEIASLCTFLLLENTYVTGQTIVADGGL